MVMGTFLLSLFGGPAAGIIGSVVSNVFGSVTEHFKNKQEMEAKQADRAHELLLLDRQAELRAGEQESEERIAMANSLADQLGASYDHDASYGAPAPWAATVLRFVRPTLTLMLVAFEVAIYFTYSGDLKVEVDGATGEVAMLSVQDKLVLSVIFLTEMAFTWWFADRRIGRKAEK
jgi:hypothetical protein